jgi:hypothetical protein
MLAKYRELDKIFRACELSDEELDKLYLEIGMLEDQLLLTDIPLEEIYKR